jgi:hypothetical protein
VDQPEWVGRVCERGRVFEGGVGVSIVARRACMRSNMTNCSPIMLPTHPMCVCAAAPKRGALILHPWAKLGGNMEDPTVIFQFRCVRPVLAVPQAPSGSSNTNPTTPARTTTQGRHRLRPVQHSRALQHARRGGLHHQARKAVGAADGARGRPTGVTRGGGGAAAAAWCLSVCGL